MGQTAESSNPALTEARGLFETVLHHLHEGIVVTAPRGELIYANDAAARLAGYASAAELSAAPPGEARARLRLFDIDGEPLPPERLPGPQALAGEDPATMIVRFGAGPQTSKPVVQVRAFGVRDASGAPQYAIMIFREADELGRSDAQREVADRHAELDREAQRTTALLDALYGAAPVGLGFWNRDLRFVRVNERLAEINGRPAADHVGRTFAEVVPQLAPLLEPMVRRVLERGEPVIAFELTASSPSRPDVPRHWLVSYYPVFAADGESLGVGGVVEEITQIRRAEQRRALQLAVTEVLTIADATADTVPRVLETICATLDWDIACYWSTDPDQPPVTWARPGRRFDGFIASTRRAALSSTTFAGGVAGSGKAEWLDDLHPASFGRASVAYAEGLKSGVAFPVVVEGQVLGVLEAFSAARREEDPDLMQTLIGIGAQLGQFLRRRRAEEERQQLLQRERIARAEAEAAASTLRKLGRVSEAALERSSLNDLLRSLLARIVEVLEADTAAILLLEEDGLLHVRATVGLDDEVERAPAVPMGAGMAGRVAELRTPLLAPDLSQVELVSPVLRDRGINSLVAIPLIVDDRVIGVLHAGSVAFAQFVEDDARLLELIGDRIAMAINQAALYDAEQVAQNRLQFLGEASMLLASSLDVGATLKRVARLAVPHFTDWCSVDLLEAGGAIKRVAVEHVDPRKLELARRLIAASPPSIEDEFGVGAVIRTGEPVLSEEADESALRAAFGNRPGYLDTLLSFDLTSTIIVPLIARDRTLGALTFVSTESERRYRAADLLFAQELAARAAVAVDNAHLYSAAERRRDRLAFLAEASALLGSSLDVDRTLERLGDLLAESFADWVAIHLARADGPPQLVTISDGEREQKPPAAGHLRAREQPPPLVARVLASGESARWPPSAGGESPGAVERERGLHSGLIVPLIARSRILGTLSLARGEGAEPYDDDDVEFAEDMAHRAAIAIDNAQLYREAEERAQAARVLASVGDGVFFVDRNGVVRTWNGAAATATGLALPDVVDRPAVEAIPGWMEIVTRVPIVAAGSAAPRAESLPLDLGGRELWLSIHGVVVPDGIVYAFRDQTEERALETMRTEFVSTVSHELRTPLAAIYGAAMTLRRKDVALNEGQRASLLDVVSGEADRLARTVNDILWASRLDTDTLHVTIENCDPVELARDVVDAQLTHLDLAHELVLSAGPDLPAVAGDPDKVARVLINLIDNALKYSPDGGRVEVTVHLVGSHVRFSVADAGLGVPAAEQRRIFEKFYRLDPNMNRGVGGTGLGLYICRELVRRMEGRIWVDSDGVGSGSTFHVELPVAGDFTARYA